ncbi:hypothetical protein CEXT_316291 [Caerostris extrusa]|uniref:Uncharacterized protein n=1 Tax=Caerostris extrusa TaxID=172846 RepID=A0AAV4VLN7_CAEEX|nr:hypothetical protein CEXT_316291 [Caerostris extrusa]
MYPFNNAAYLCNSLQAKCMVFSEHLLKESINNFSVKSRMIVTQQLDGFHQGHSCDKRNSIKQCLENAPSLYMSFFRALTTPRDGTDKARIGYRLPSESTYPSNNT